MSEIDEPVLSNNDDNLTFSRQQIEYLRDEFDRQRRWVNLLSTREKLSLEELKQTQTSISYKLGRCLTWAPRKFLKLVRQNDKGKITHYFKEDEERKEEELFPSSLLITPELLPTSSSVRKVDNVVEELLIMIKRGNISVNQARDKFSEESFVLDDSQMLEAAIKVMEFIQKVTEYNLSINNIYVGILRSLAQKSSLSATVFGDLFQNKLNDDRALRALIQAHSKCGNFSRPLEYLKKSPKDSWRKSQERKFVNANRILQKGVKIKMPKPVKFTPKAFSILYHASQSMPHTTSGYAIRTHGLVSALNSKQYNIDVVLRHGYPLDRNDFKPNQISGLEKIDAVNYHFSPSEIDRTLINYQEVYNFNNLERYFRRSISSIFQHAQNTKPSVIHSASNFVVGMAGARAAKALGIPSIYEIRGFWHLTQSTKRLGYEGSDHYNLTERLEIETAKLSDHVFTITNALKDILIEHGIAKEKITVLPNAVNPNKFKIAPKNRQLEKELKFHNKVVIGYIGSFVEYEGLDLLIEACSILNKKLGDCFRLLLVGDGDMMQVLRKSVRFLQLEDIVKFTGRVSHDQVQEYYSLIDIAPLPRRGFRVCELVSPLKPFEAMASGKVLITSSVEALAEIINDGETGFVFEKDNALDLADKLELVILNESLRKQVGITANKWVIENHSWDVICKRVTHVYQKLIEGK